MNLVPSPTSHEARQDQGGLKVLVCDDDPTTRMVLRRVLSKDGSIHVAEAEDGLQALQWLQRERCDLLFLDLTMPLMGGLETLDIIRSHPSLRDLPVLVVSGESDPEIVRQVIGMGVEDFLAKPLSRSTTQQRLIESIAKLRARGPSRGHGTQGPTSGPRLSPGDRILVADPSDDFRYFCRTVLQRRFTIVEAGSGADALAMMLAEPPSAVLIGRNLPMLDSDKLAERLQSMGLREKITVLGVSPRSEVAGMSRSGLYDACLTRTFIPDTLDAQIDQLLPRAEVSASLFARAPELRTQIATATEQAFGMMVKMEVEPVDRPLAPFAPPYLTGLIGITIGTEFEAQLQLRCSTASGEAFAVSMFGEPAALDALQELVNIIGGRVKHAIVARGMSATLGLPKIETMASNWDPSTPVGGIRTRFAVIESPHELEVALRVDAIEPADAEASAA